MSKNSIGIDLNSTDFYKKADLIRERPEVAMDALHLLLGKHLGTGAFRDVYEYAMDPKWVMKVQKNRDCHNNLIEHEIWRDVSYTDYNKWFAPCNWISDNGLILMQRKIIPLTYKDKNKIPKEIPYFFTDIKPDNFGWLGKQLVCHDYDYSMSMFISNGLRPRMKSSKDLIQNL